MYGNSGKFGRGGGSGGRGGATKRPNPLNSSFHSTPPTHRSSSATPGSRLSSGHRSRSTTPAPMASSAPSSTEETFSVVTKTPLDFAMIIRLAPDLVEEIKRVEADGGTARIKFDPNANNTSGNVIHVGSKDFRFTWSREMGDLCDIYEERQSGEDGNGLLVESGCAWRKLNVQRVLDESTKNHVKMRSVEAEKNKKLRKTITLEPGNPSMKSQVKALAAAEATPWRKHVKQKEPEFKKRKIEGPPAINGPPKSVHKSGLPSSTPSKGMPSASPLPFTPENHGASSSPVGTRTPAKGTTSVEDVMIQGASQKSVASFEKDMLNRAGTVREKQVHMGNIGAKSTDLQSMLISVLKENPKGMSMKQLEKAIGDTIPNSGGKIEPIVKKIATYQAPGRYVLKPGIELEDFKKPLSGSGSSPQDNRHQTPAPAEKDRDILAPSVSFVQTDATEEVEKQAQLDSNVGEDMDSLENVDILNSPPRVDDKKISERSEGHTDSSSESGSDSESESSDSGSDSGSHSRSRSKSRSASSSDSDSDASSNSKQGSDEDVDILSDDEKEPKPQSQAPALGVTISPVPWISEDGPLQNGNEKQDDNDSDIVEIEKDSSDEDQRVEMGASNLSSIKENEKTTNDVSISSPDLHELHGSQVYRGNLLGERETFSSDGSKVEQTSNSERAGKGKSKRSAESKHLHDKSEHTKRQKSGSFPQTQISQGRDLLFSESPHNLSPYRITEEPSKAHANGAANKTLKTAGDCPAVQKSLDQGLRGKSISEERSGGRPVETSVTAKSLDLAEKAGVASENFGRGIKYPERNHQLNDGLPIHKDKFSKGVHDEELFAKEKKMPRNSKESGFRDKHSVPFDSYYNGTHGEVGGKIKEAGEISEMQMASPPKNDSRTDPERSPFVNGRGKILEREVSLELGEFREPLPEDIAGPKKDFVRKGSFKLSENKRTTSALSNSDLSKGRYTGMAESGKPSSPVVWTGVSSNPESSLKRRSPEHHAEDIRRSNSKDVQYQPPGSQQMSRVDPNDPGTQKLAHGNGKKASAVGQQQPVNVRGPLTHPPKEIKAHKSSILSDLSDIQKDTSLTGSDEGGLKRRESSSDENSCSYSKYEKEDPEFRGPIRDFTQYKECVQEYREKYDSYCSLNKTLESYRCLGMLLQKVDDTAYVHDKIEWMYKQANISFPIE